MSIIVKACLFPNEIRRFSVDASACSSFDFMRQRLHHIFNVCLEEPFFLSWKDDEGDFIRISSNEELQDAVNNREDGLLRLYLSPRNTPPPEATPSSPDTWQFPAFMGPSPWGCHKWGRKFRKQFRECHRRQQNTCGTGTPEDQQQVLLQLGEVMSSLMRPLGVDVTVIPTQLKEKAASEAEDQQDSQLPSKEEDKGDEKSEMDTSGPSVPSHVVQARELMLRMGFKDDGGWLTGLLTIMDGDIAKALDAIKVKSA